MKTLDEVESAVRNSNLRTSPELDDEILRKAGLELEVAVGTSRAQRSMLSYWWVSAMRGRPLKLAAATAALFGLVLAAELVTVFDMGGVAWAEVADRIAQMDRFMFSVRISISDEAASRESEDSVNATRRDVALSYFVSSSLGFRWDVFTDGSLATSFVYPSNADSGIAINYEEKTWARISASAAAPQSSEVAPIDDPETYVRRFLEREFTDLGRRTIDGIEVEGVEVINPPTRFGPGIEPGPEMEGRGRLWVGIESGLPVRIELVQQLELQHISWTLDFRWGEQVDAAAFEAIVPDGFSEAR